MKLEDLEISKRSVSRIGCVLATQLMALVPAVLADTSAWTVLGIQDTGASRGYSLVAAMSAAGGIYSITYCPSPTFKFGDSSRISTCVTKADTSGRQVFATLVGGAASIHGLVIDQADNAYILGDTDTLSGFSTTSGAYESNPPGPYDNWFVCKLSGIDGHPLFCTFIDVQTYGGTAASAFAVDEAGNSYLAGTCPPDSHLCVEKLNVAGTGLLYRSETNLPPGELTYAAADPQGNLFVSFNSGIAKLNASGTVIASASGFEPLALAVAPAGNPFQPSRNPQVFIDGSPYGLDVRRYSADLAAVLSDTQLSIPTGYPGPAMSIDPEGITTLWGGLSGVNLGLVNPTQVCYPRSSAFLVRLDNNGDVLESTFLNIPPLFIAGTALSFHSGGASLLYGSFTEADFKILNLGPAASEITLGCIGSAASFANSVLAPNEIVSLFGGGIGPVQAVTGKPDANGLYPFELGGTQVTFDGIRAPLLYVSSSQVNLVTPGGLQGKSTTHVCATVGSTATNCIDVGVAPAAPDVFLSGGYAAALNQDGTLNSPQNPALVGSAVSVFLTGVGAATPSAPDGGITPYPPPAQDLRAKVLFDWYICSFIDCPGPTPVSAQVLYAGPAPLEVEGLWQINFVIPPAPGCPSYIPFCSVDSEGVQIDVGGAASPSFRIAYKGAP